MIRIGKHPENMPVAELNAYINFMAKQHPDVRSGTLDVELIDGEEVGLSLKPDIVRFQRIRRITGYLVGDLSRFNNAKRAEEHDRVKHGLH